MREPLVSVIIPNFNYARFLGEAIESVMGQTYTNIEVIVVDDGSSDDSLKVARSFGEKVRLIEQENSGVSAARNRGIGGSTGELVAFLDSDDVWHSKKLEKQVALFQDNEGIGLVHCGYVEIDDQDNRYNEYTDGMAGDVASEMLKYERPVILGGGSAAVVRRSVLEDVGGFDPLVTPAEDWEFYFRCASVSKVGFIPEVLLSYRVHDKNAHSNIQKMERGILAAYQKSFETDDPDLLAIRDQCFGKIHSVLAGSYFSAGSYRSFARHAIKSIILAPKLSVRYLAFPVRYLARSTKGRSLSR